MNQCFFLGLDIGSSSVKASLLDGTTGSPIASASSPKTEMDILAPKPDWAEQHPETWWNHVQLAIQELREQAPKAFSHLCAIGISYQMHGLVLLNRKGEVLRNAIIWCDSRAVPYGERAFQELGKTFCLTRFLNSPGNFTAAKLAWVKEHEPEIFKALNTVLLPGDYIAYRFTGELSTTPSGLSEMILWDYETNGVAQALLEYFGFPTSILPPILPTFAIQGKVTKEVSKVLGIPSGIPVSYRAGDQPNNAFSLGVLEPGELAATAGTSGVVYGILDRAAYDPLSRVNTFVHVNHSQQANNPRLGVLLCLNGTGILYRWLKQNTLEGSEGEEYERMNFLASQVPIGSDGLLVFPYGNGAERTLGNRNLGAIVQNLNFNLHRREHLYRASQEGIVFALQYGLEIMESMGIQIKTVKAGYTNMFLSPIFRTAFTAVTGARLLLYETDGAEGAARGAAVGCGYYRSFEEAFKGLKLKAEETPDPTAQAIYKATYTAWRTKLNEYLRTCLLY
ncbi:MAG: FGGY family carbohydrate kinase, partial [Spirochaetes bacterium]|nr:FGGY family carbohydrate kinase [Spirochaetota bacterium]